MVLRILLGRARRACPCRRQTEAVALPAPPPADSRSEPVLRFLLAGGTTAQIAATLGITQEEVALRIMRRLRPLPPPDLAAAQ